MIGGATVINVSGIGSGLGDLGGTMIDLDDILSSPLGKTITDTARNFAITTSREIGRVHTIQLQQFGRRITKSAVGQVVKPLPFWIRNYVMPDYEEPQPFPSWIGEVANPLLNPVVYGAKMEATERANRIAPLAITLGVTALLTVFAAGYVLGSVTRKTG